MNEMESDMSFDKENSRQRRRPFSQRKKDQVPDSSDLSYAESEKTDFSVSSANFSPVAKKRRPFSLRKNNQLAESINLSYAESEKTDFSVSTVNFSPVVKRRRPFSQWKFKQPPESKDLSYAESEKTNLSVASELFSPVGKKRRPFSRRENNQLPESIDLSYAESEKTTLSAASEIISPIVKRRRPFSRRQDNQVPESIDLSYAESDKTNLSATSAVLEKRKPFKRPFSRYGNAESQRDVELSYAESEKSFNTGDDSVFSKKNRPFKKHGKKTPGDDAQLSYAESDTSNLSVADDRIFSPRRESSPVNAQKGHCSRENKAKSGKRLFSYKRREDQESLHLSYAESVSSAASEESVGQTSSVNQSVANSNSRSNIDISLPESTGVHYMSSNVSECEDEENLQLDTSAVLEKTGLSTLRCASIRNTSQSIADGSFGLDGLDIGKNLQPEKSVVQGDDVCPLTLDTSQISCVGHPLPLDNPEHLQQQNTDVRECDRSPSTLKTASIRNISQSTADSCVGRSLSDANSVPFTENNESRLVEVASICQTSQSIVDIRDTSQSIADARNTSQSIADSCVGRSLSVGTGVSGAQEGDVEACHSTPGSGSIHEVSLAQKSSCVQGDCSSAVVNPEPFTLRKTIPIVVDSVVTPNGDPLPGDNTSLALGECSPTPLMKEKRRKPFTRSARKTPGVEAQLSYAESENNSTLASKSVVTPNSAVLPGDDSSLALGTDSLMPLSKEKKRRPFTRSSRKTPGVETQLSYAESENNSTLASKSVVTPNSAVLPGDNSSFALGTDSLMPLSKEKKRRPFTRSAVKTFDTQQLSYAESEEYNSTLASKSVITSNSDVLPCKNNTSSALGDYSPTPVRKEQKRRPFRKNGPKALSIDNQLSYADSIDASQSIAMEQGSSINESIPEALPDNTTLGNRTDVSYAGSSKTDLTGSIRSGNRKLAVSLAGNQPEKGNRRLFNYRRREGANESIQLSYAESVDSSNNLTKTRSSAASESSRSSESSVNESVSSESSDRSESPREESVAVDDSQKENSVALDDSQRENSMALDDSQRERRSVALEDSRVPPLPDSTGVHPIPVSDSESLNGDSHLSARESLSVKAASIRNVSLFSAHVDYLDASVSGSREAEENSRPERSVVMDDGDCQSACQSACVSGNVSIAGSSVNQSLSINADVRESYLVDNDLTTVEEDYNERIKQIIQQGKENYLKKKNRMKELLATPPRAKPKPAAKKTREPRQKPFKLYKPAKWVTNKLYKVLQNKLLPAFGPDYVLESERVMEVIYKTVVIVEKSKSYEKDAVDRLKRTLAERKVVETTFDFYNFVRDYLPDGFRRKVIPSVQPFTNIVWPPRDHSKGYWEPIL